MSHTVHINPLRWFTDGEGGLEFVESFGTPVPADLLEEARAASYPGVGDVLAVLRGEGLSARCWFTLWVDGAEVPDPLPARPGSADGDHLGGFAVAVAGERKRIGADEPASGLTFRAPGAGAAERAVAALAEAFGPQVMWAGDVGDVVVVPPGLTAAQVRERRIGCDMADS
ncbi:hypothetical protein [Embleya scabrispora]|uniref:hypothetical protein n=1 Tax=Embleya scabrispora TaxID=159449 RepID=UPI0003737553|nr:hypothetical protein [Embleya scabrispora]MYS79007.1 hypothetical protein [Streptomyces sp. SID5474]